MSPAMVNFQPSASTSKLQSDPPQSQSSFEGRIPSSPSRPLFRRSSIPELSPSMDRTNLGQGFLASFSAPEKTAPVPGLSKPRFLKQRKHSGNSRGRPAAPASEDDSAPGFNPFRSEKLDAARLYQVEDSGAQKMREQLYDRRQVNVSRPEMSPAMVNFQPSASTSKLQSDPPESQSSFEGCIPSSPSRPVFRQSSIPEPSPSMDRTNLGQGFLVSFSAPEKPAPVPGHSKPRFLKQRKHSANSRGRPAAPASQDDSAPEFNLFRSEKLDAAPRCQASDSGAHKVREQLYGWKPFIPVASSCANSGAGYASSSNTGPGSIQGSAFDHGKNGGGNAGTGLFIFESGMEKDSSLSCFLSQKSSARSLGSADSSISEGALNAGSFSESNVGSVETGIGVRASVCSASAGNVFSDTDVFIFGSSSKKYGNLHHRSSLRSDDGSFSALNLQQPVNQKIVKLESGSFVFKGGQMKSTDSSNNSSFGCGESLFSEQSERTNKADQQNSSYENCQKADMGVYVLGSFGKTKAYSDQSSSMCFHESSSPELSEDLKKLKIVNSGNKDPDVENKSTNASKCSSFGSFDSTFSKLPEKMEKLNLQNSADEDHRDTNSIDFVPGSSLEKGTNFNQTSTSGLDEGAFSSLHREFRKLNLQTSGNEHGNANNDVFVFGSSIKRNTNSGKSSSLIFDESSFSKLPDEIGKMKLSTSGNEDYYQKTKQGDPRMKHRNKDATTSSVASAAHKLQEKIEELKIDNGTTFPMGASDFKPGTFVVESGANNSLSSYQTSKVPSRVSHNCMSSKLQDEMRKFSVDATANNVCVEETNRSVFGQKGDANGVIFGTANGSSGYSGENGLHTINTVSKTADSSGRVDRVSVPGGIASYASGSSNTLQSAKEDRGCRFAALQTHDFCRCSAETASCISSVPVFQSSTTDFIFTGLHTGIESPRTDFRNQKQDASWLTRENPFTKPYKKMTFGMKKGNFKGVRLKKKRGKSRQSPPSQPGIAKQFVSENNVLEEILEQDAFGRYSPMDYSPYQESLLSSQCPREASIAADVSIHFDSRYKLTDTRISASVDGKDEELVTETEHNDTNEGLPENEANCSKIPFGRRLTSDCSLADEMASGLQSGSLVEKDENVGSGIQTRTSSMESKSFSFGSSIKQPATEGENGFTFTSPSKDVGQSNFLFASTSSVQSPLSASNHSYQSKIRVKGGQASHPNTKVPLVSTPNLFLFPNASVAAGCMEGQKGSYEDKGPGKVNEAKANQESKATAAASDAAQEACEKWRLWGNQAYEDGNLSKAEDYYTLGVKSVSMNEISKNCSRALMLCYSNRAATRMSLVRLREALGDCKMALEIDPNFLRAQVRAGNIHLSLGESRDALQYFEMCLQLDNETENQKILLEAAEGLQKTQKLKDLMDQSSVLLTKSTSNDVSKALEIITEALFISPYSESLLEMKAETLLMLRNYEEAIRLCERTLELAEKNAVITEADKDINNLQSLERSYVRLWRWRIISRSYFYLGKLDEANELLQKHEKEKPVIEKCGNRYPETSASFPNIVRELLRLKNAGNEAFQAGRHLEAVELYTAALALNTESRPFTAVCFCNRAAAYQALGQITNAIADCSIAIALDSSYRKAISRRASLHEMIGDYGQAATDLRKLISLLEKGSEDEYNASGALGRSISNIDDLNQACMWLSTVEEEARKGAMLDMYMILGIERSSSAADVRKVYHKAALRHHPDKAVPFLARSENGDDNIWREVAEEVHSDADKLFKMIGEAYTILVDPQKRLQYDAEQELRTMKKGYAGSSSPRTPASTFNSRYKSSSDRHPQRTYGSTH